MRNFDEAEITCNAGHVHKNARSADQCEQRREERARAVEVKEAGQILLVAPEFAEHNGSYFINRRKKSWKNRV